MTQFRRWTLLLTLFFVLPAALSAQTTVFSDNFNTSQGATYTTAGAIGTSVWSVTRLLTPANDFGARIDPDRLELTNDASASSNVNGWIYASTSTAAFSSPYNTTLSSNTGVVTWNFNLQQVRTNPAGFRAIPPNADYGVAFIIGSTSTDVHTTGDGYAIVLGNTGTPDPVRFVKFTGGISSIGNTAGTGLIIASSTLDNPGVAFMSIRLTYTPSTNTWELFGRNDGVSFTDPTTGTLTSLGTAVDNQYTGVPLTSMGGYWQGSTAASQFSIFDNVSVTVTPAGPPDFTGGATIAPGTYNNVTLDQNCTISPAGNVTVNGVLNLGSFRLDAGSNLVIVANDAEAAIVATPGVGRINGGLRRAVIAPSVSARTYAFPLGDATRNRGVVVALPNTAGTSPTLTAAFDGTNPGTGGIGSLTPTVSNVWPGGFWRVSQNNLISTAYSIALSTDGVDGILNPSTVRIIKRPDAATNWTEAVVSSPVTLSGLTGQQASFLTGFSEFGFGGAGDNPLPVELSSFTGSATAAGVNLRWTTQSELNNAGFAVFRNGEEIASYRFSPALRGKGTAVGATNYAFLDAGVEVGQRYTYRLRSFDLDGTIHDYPQTVSVEVREPISQRVFNYDLSQNFPNPFNPTTSIKYSIREAGNVSLKVYDLLGREVLTLVNQVQAPGEYQVSFDASNLAASGMYIYRLQSGNFTRTMKMLLVK